MSIFKVGEFPRISPFLKSNGSRLHYFQGMESYSDIFLCVVYMWFQSYLRWSEMELPEVTSPEAVITATEVIASTCAAGSCGISALVGPFRRK